MGQMPHPEARTTVRFPDSFIFGASTAAYQIEGAWDADGKGESIWDRFSHTPSRVRNGDTGDVACDHYHRFGQDFDLAKLAGMQACRFSLTWTRLFPDGTGARNEAGFAFYDRLVDGCLERGLDPWPCLYHWDLPQTLQDRGGWAARDSIGWYVDYATAAERPKDRCRKLVLFNEPRMFTLLGYQYGVHAPGLKDPHAYGAAIHHVNLATADGLRCLRDVAPQAELGTVLALNWFAPQSARPEDRTAAAMADALMNRAFADPLFFGRYPEQALPLVEPHVRGGDRDRLAARVDFLGISHYTRTMIAAPCPDDPGAAGAGFVWKRPAQGVPTTAFGWEIYPDGMRDILV